MDTNRDVNAETVEKVDTDEKEKDEKDGKKGGRGCGCWIALILFLLAGGGATAYVGGTTLLRTEKPLPLEEQVTDLAKRWIMIPGEFADMRMPDRPGITVETGRTLFIDGDFGGRQTVGCALCHGPSGMGDSRLGAAMYPAANDLTAQGTQSKSDGQLFWLIAHGLNLTGMPAWGNSYTQPAPGYTDDELWSLVKYIRSIRR
ncbi:MAG TPA: cytochrome c [Chloroflexia bacterium]|nr:cytochrome c [Chloroflexia bacterium]